MLVYLLKDVENIGMRGTVIKVADGYGKNFLIPRKCAIEVTAENRAHYENRVIKAESDKEAVKSKLGMLAEHIKGMHLTIKKRIHDDGKLYGSVSPEDIVDLLKAKDVAITRKQVVFGKAVRSVGEHMVGVKLSTKFQPEFSLKVVSE